MDWQIVANIATVIEAVVVTLSVIFIWRQIRQQTKLARIANVQSLVEISSPFNMQLIQDHQMADLWVNGYKDFEKYDKVKKHQYNSLLIWWLIFHENVFYQWKSGLLDKRAYSPWEYDLGYFVKDQHLELRWENMKGFFQQDFRNHIDELIAQNTNQA